MHEVERISSFFLFNGPIAKVLGSKSDTQKPKFYDMRAKCVLPFFVRIIS